MHWKLQYSEQVDWCKYQKMERYCLFSDRQHQHYENDNTTKIVKQIKWNTDQNNNSIPCIMQMWHQMCTPPKQNKIKHNRTKSNKNYRSFSFVNIPQSFTEFIQIQYLFIRILSLLRHKQCLFTVHQDRELHFDAQVSQCIIFFLLCSQIRAYWVLTRRVI